MKYIFDASALLNIVRSLGPKAIPYLKDGYVLTLTLYEVGNALWKEATLLNRLSIDEALLLMEAIEQVYKLLNVISPHDNSLVLKLAHELGLTYYDSSYVVTASELNAELITDDMKLKKRIEGGRNKLLKLLGKEIILHETREIIEDN